MAAQDRPVGRVGANLLVLALGHHVLSPEQCLVASPFRLEVDDVACHAHPAWYQSAPLNFVECP